MEGDSSATATGGLDELSPGGACGGTGRASAGASVLLSRRDGATRIRAHSSSAGGDV